MLLYVSEKASGINWTGVSPFYGKLMRVTRSLDTMPFESYSMVHEADSDLIHLWKYKVLRGIFPSAYRTCTYGSLKCIKNFSSK